MKGKNPYSHIKSRFVKPIVPMLERWPGNALYIPQAYGGIFHMATLGPTAVGTCGLATCLGVVLYSDTHIYLAHFDDTTPGTAAACADAAIDRLRELSTGMDVYCRLVNVGNSAAMAAEVRNVCQVRVVPIQSESNAGDFFVTCNNGVTVHQSHPVFIPGNEFTFYQTKFNESKAASVGQNKMYRTRNQNQYLHMPAQNYEAP